MATPKQKKLAQMIVDNSKLDKPLNSGVMLEKVGYSKSVAEAKSKDIIDSEGVRKELEVLGFTEENARTVVSEIMLNKEADNSSRLKATDQVFKVLGGYAPEKKVNLNANATINLNKEQEQIILETEDKLIDLE